MNQAEQSESKTDLQSLTTEELAEVRFKLGTEIARRMKLFTDEESRPRRPIHLAKMLCVPQLPQGDKEGEVPYSENTMFKAIRANSTSLSSKTLERWAKIPELKDLCLAAFAHLPGAKRRSRARTVEKSHNFEPREIQHHKLHVNDVVDVVTFRDHDGGAGVVPPKGYEISDIDFARRGGEGREIHVTFILRRKA